MKGAIETAISIIAIAFMAVLATSYIMLSLNTQRAQNYHSMVVSEIEASDYAADVISACQTKAVENGYTGLKIEKKTNVNGRPYAKVTLTYKNSIPILGMDTANEIVGYAR